MTTPRGVAGWMTRARRGLQLVADLVAFVVESACVGNGIFWFLTWGMLSFNWEFTAREYGRFWTHYAKASSAARHPVEVAAAIVLAVITVLVAAVRAPAAKPICEAWRRTRRPFRRAPSIPQGLEP